ncbi:MAG: nickel/cobalt transporter [Xanthobacteraceae bacterium]|nr:nickel/cobalt transporter [Xanthobacteraceae bacterium]MCW5675012.1 nickel/cobalt transporter [Xanthobacteraceae bacterium]
MLCVLLLAAAAFVVFVEPALAQSPFGPRVQQPTGIMGWIFSVQASFYAKLRDAIKAAKTDGSAAWALVTISFLYGIFHAAGPGHGKAVIASYMVADDATWKRGALLAAISAFVQACVAVAFVGIAVLLLGTTARNMNIAASAIEIVAYSLIVLLGLYLLWKKGAAFVAAWRGKPDAHGHHHGHGHGHDHDHAHHHHDHGHDHHGHSHGPEPAELKGKDWFRRGMVAAVAAGLRPCSGAIIVLVFAISQGIFLIGIASTFAMGAGVAITVTAIALLAVFGKGLAVRLAGSMGGRGELMLRGIEVGGALVVIALGLLLLTGYLAYERLLPF